LSENTQNLSPFKSLLVDEMSTIGEGILQLPQYAKLLGVLKEFKLPNESLIDILELAHAKISHQAEIQQELSSQEGEKIKKHIESLHRNEMEYVKNIDTIVKVRRKQAQENRFKQVIFSLKFLLTFHTRLENESIIGMISNRFRTIWFQFEHRVKSPQMCF
jgi:hypothetical protein